MGKPPIIQTKPSLPFEIKVGVLTLFGALLAVGGIWFHLVLYYEWLTHPRGFNWRDETGFAGTVLILTSIILTAGIGVAVYGMLTGFKDREGPR